MRYCRLVAVDRRSRRRVEQTKTRYDVVFIDADTAKGRTPRLLRGEFIRQQQDVAIALPLCRKAV